MCETMLIKELPTHLYIKVLNHVSKGAIHSLVTDGKLSLPGLTSPLGSDFRDFAAESDTDLHTTGDEGAADDVTVEI